MAESWTRCNEKDAKDSAKKGIVYEIERYAIHDGPGIRTVVFLKGCPLTCLWCANPESQKNIPELIYWPDRCLGCGRCVRVCPNAALSMTSGAVRIHREKCTVCGECAQTCNAQALTVIGREMTSCEIVEEVLKDEMFYVDSGGGVTFSGGEPFSQPKLLLETAMLCKQRQIHTCVETCGFAKWETIEAVIPYIDLILYDFKMMDGDEHERLTGVRNDLILDNFKRLAKLEKDLVVRVPVIPNLNDSTDNYLEMMAFLQKHVPGARVDLLPYHRLGVSKYTRMHMDYQLRELLPPSQGRMKGIEEQFRTGGFNVTIGGLSKEDEYI